MITIPISMPTVPNPMHAPMLLHTPPYPCLCPTCLSGTFPSLYPTARPPIHVLHSITPITRPIFLPYSPSYPYFPTTYFSREVHWSFSCWCIHVRLTIHGKSYPRQLIPTAVTHSTSPIPCQHLIDHLSNPSHDYITTFLRSLTHFLSSFDHPAPKVPRKYPLSTLHSLKLSISRSSSSFNSLAMYRVATSFISKIRIAKNNNHQISSRLNWKQKTQMQMQILLRKWLSLRKQSGLRMMNFVRKNIHAVYSFASVAYQRHTHLTSVWYGSFEPRSTEMNKKQSIGSQFIWSLVQSVTDLCRRWN